MILEAPSNQQNAYIVFIYDYMVIVEPKTPQKSNFNHQMCNFLNFKYKVERKLMILEASRSQ